MHITRTGRISFVSTLLVLLCTGFLGAQTFGGSNGLNLTTSSGDGEGPAITFESNVIELGTYKKGDVVTLDVPFSSSGSEALEVEHVKPSCTCSDLTWTEKALAPKEEGKIHAEINTDEMEAGEKTKYFTVLYNGNPGVERVTIKFTLKEG